MGSESRKILGISAFYHDSAAALVVDGEIIAAAQEERFTRKKHTADFPAEAIKYCLEEGGLTIDELDAVVFYDKPLLKFERLIETYYALSPRGFKQFAVSIPVWLREKMFIKKMIRDGLSEVGSYDRRRLNLLFPEHHLSHAASAFFPSPFEEAAILTIDGVGEWATATIGYGRGEKIEILKEMRFPHSVGLLYSAFTWYLGFRVNSGEYKLMGLAPYGNPQGDESRLFEQKIRSELVSVKEDGSIWLNQRYFRYASGLKMVHERRWESLFGLPPLRSGEEPTQLHCDLAWAIQHVTDDIVFRMARESKRLTGSKQLCLAGGVALNCVSNGRLLKSGLFEDLFIQPAAGDAGGALGGALAAHQFYFGGRRLFQPGADSMKGAYLGPSFSDKEALSVFRRYKAVYREAGSLDALCDEVSRLLDRGEIVGWFQGRMEFGPRALGNRSILADPRNSDMQRKLNLKIKYREGFRPFAPSVLAESSEEYFDLEGISPYMLLVADVKKERRNPLPDNYQELDLWQRLYTERSDIPSVTHLDFSARVQTVHRETNPVYHRLIEAFQSLTGYGVLVNTSFNVRGEPIVCTPDDAYRCFMRTEIDYLIVNNYILCKKDQPDWQDREQWKETFNPD